MHVRLLFTGRSYLLGEALPDQLELPAGARLGDALAELTRQLPAGQTLPRSCLVSVGGRHLGTVARHDDCPLADGDELVLIAPVAGG